MSKFHINPESGEAGKCSATKGGCPFGGDSDHFTSAEAARSFFEDKQSEVEILAPARADLERWGENSSVFRPWAKIHADFKSSSEGKRMVIANGAGLGTVLTPWHGPKVLEQLKLQSLERRPLVEPTPGMFWLDND